MSGEGRKVSGRVVVESVEVTDGRVRESLSSRARELTAEEEKVVRLRRGAAVDPHAPLARKASGEVLDELLLFELEVRRRYKAHLARTQGPAPRASAAKDKVVRALRKKKA